MLIIPELRTIKDAGKSLRNVGLWSGQSYLLTRRFSRGIPLTSLAANLPQLLLTQIYMLYNNLFTRKTVFKEWTTFGSKPKSLRVTDPRGEQRSTHYLSLPFRYAIPLLIGSVALHWLASQSLYVVCLAVFDWNGQPVDISDDGTSTGSIFGPDSTNEFYRTGFSCLSLILSTVVCLLLMLVGWIDDYRSVQSVMPLVGSCSAAISASCYAESENAEMILRPLKWGVITRDNDVAHCSFTDEVDSVLLPKDGELASSARREYIWCPKEWRSPSPHEHCPQCEIIAQPRWERLLLTSELARIVVCDLASPVLRWIKQRDVEDIWDSRLAGSSPID